MKVGILIGSSRPGRQSHKIAYYLESEIQKKGIDADIIDLGKKASLITEKEVDLYAGLREEMEVIGTRMQEADGLIFITPEYHGSYSGILKITLDTVSTNFSRKPIGIVAVSSGNMGGLAAAVHLQAVILHIGAYALPHKLLIPDVQNAFDDSFQLINERTLKSAKKFLDEYFWLAEAVCTKAALKKTTSCNRCALVSLEEKSIS